ncbi:hypothetical protein [Photobacterium leiognathi]|uniref:hypothetical protein n=1 Tax=Photobacterium leiognathi TaxID=553611 RepID=UPI002981F669|nr:hypothetical protein [Photobacterium leiognathi]
MLLKHGNLYSSKLSRALACCGEYVYAYYQDGDAFPFYVGKGKGTRVLEHWNKAITSPTKDHEKKIREILTDGGFPQLKLLAYNLDESTLNQKAYDVAERVLQEAFGIQSVWEKMQGKERIKEIPSFLLQKREESSKYPTLSLDAVLCKADLCGVLDKASLIDISTKENMPILLVGLSQTYHPKYNQSQLGEMARMYWNLSKYQNTSLPQLLSGNAYLLAWSSKINKKPMIVGAWTIDGENAILHKKSQRYEFPLVDDYRARKLFIGKKLEGRGNRWQGQKIFTQSS